ncbi:MAG: GGDEF domain-containing protein [Alphaproteobacteria bacterium]|nr:GGDEF domain-containing protein [Alphaproteobacteria bacterium]MCB9985236.1 GGDEF domain-containing protein [Micavibrio sp.]
MSDSLNAKKLIKILKNELIIAQESARYWEVMATTDDLTGLHNRRMLNQVEINFSERRCKDHENEITLLFIDLDDFGQLNKIYGDNIGDDALRLLGQMIRRNIRDTDLAIRKGGDEFVLFLIETTPQMANKAVVKRLELMLDGELSLSVQGNTILIRGSIGVFAYQKNLSPLENLKHADLLMRTTKKKRKANKKTDATHQKPIDGATDTASAP